VASESSEEATAKAELRVKEAALAELERAQVEAEAKAAL